MREQLLGKWVTVPQGEDRAAYGYDLDVAVGGDFYYDLGALEPCETSVAEHTGVSQLDCKALCASEPGGSRQPQP